MSTFRYSFLNVCLNMKAKVSLLYLQLTVLTPTECSVHSRQDPFSCSATQLEHDRSSFVTLSVTAYIRATFHSTREPCPLCTPADALRNMYLRGQLSSRCLCVPPVPPGAQEWMRTAIAQGARHRFLDCCWTAWREGSTSALLLASVCYQETVNFSF